MCLALMLGLIFRRVGGCCGDDGLRHPLFLLRLMSGAPQKCIIYNRMLVGPTWHAENCLTFVEPGPSMGDLELESLDRGPFTGLS